MGQWTIKPAWQFVLFAVLLTIVLVQAFPQVNLRDTAFHDGTDPLVIHAQSTSAPSVLTSAVPFQIALVRYVAQSAQDAAVQPAHVATHPLTTLDGFLRC
jgi:hypothetical protein